MPDHSLHRTSKSQQVNIKEKWMAYQSQNVTKKDKKGESLGRNKEEREPRKEKSGEKERSHEI